MKKISQIMLIFIATMTLTLVSCSQNDVPSVPVTPEQPDPEPAPQPEPQKARYTVLVYGNSGGAMDQIIEHVYNECKPLMKSGEVRIAFFYKYGKEYEKHVSGDGTVTQKYIFTGRYAKPGDFVFFELKADTDLENLAEESLNAPEWGLYEPLSLSTVIDVVKEEMPAEDYVFLLYGHGGGFDANVDYPKSLRPDQEPQSGDEPGFEPGDEPAATRGVLYDEWIPTIAGPEAMDMYEFSQAIDESAIPHFKAIFFHNCLMGNMESLGNIYDKADYFITSMHILASNGDPIIELVKGLYDNTEFDKAASQMFRAIAPGMPEIYFDGFRKLNGDINLLKTSEYKQLESVFGRIARRLVELYPTENEAIDKATASAYLVEAGFPLYDALDYARKLAQATGDEALKDYADELKAAFDKFIIDHEWVIQNDKNPISEISLSTVLVNDFIYQQPTSWGYSFGEAYELTNFAQNTGWGNWLKTNAAMPYTGVSVEQP